ncbi:MAG: TrkA family potassium uptake protein [Firmicutes bacterium]|nr:TrkA family potassium uptake protein [Candidatus Fermentithermobacillaceae bacterium]
MKVVVVGGGKVGYYLVKTLLEAGHSVSLVERNEEVARRLAEDLGILVVNGDGTNQYDLADAGCDEADVVAAVTGKDEENLIVCQVAKRYFGTKRIVARINNPKNEATFAALGIDMAVSSTSMIARMIQEEVVLDRVRRLLPLGRGDISLVEIDLDESSAAAERTVRELGQKLPADCVLVSVVRENTVVFPRGDTVLKPKDVVIAIASKGSEDELRNVLIGKRRP